MELYFNELSIQGRNFSVDNLLQLLKIREFIRSFDITVCRTSCEDSNRIVNFLINNKNNDSRARDLMSGLLSFLQPPYEGSQLTDEKEDFFLQGEWQYDGKQCVGLAWVVVFETFAVSYFAPEWDKDILQVVCEQKMFSVSNFCNGEHCSHLSHQLENSQKIELVPSEIAPEDKEISLRDDHGKDILERFSKRVNRNEYVVGVINSLPYKEWEKNFIHNVMPNGIIELVLTHTDKGLGIVVQTTGRNMRETEAIAKILEERYGGV